MKVCSLISVSSKSGNESDAYWKSPTQLRIYVEKTLCGISLSLIGGMSFGKQRVREKHVSLVKSFFKKQKLFLFL